MRVICGLSASSRLLQHRSRNLLKVLTRVITAAGSYRNRLPGLISCSKDQQRKFVLLQAADFQSASGSATTRKSQV